MIFQCIFHRFLDGFWSILEPKIEPKFIKKSIKKLILFLIVFLTVFPESPPGEGFSFNVHLRGFQGGRPWGPGRRLILFRLPSKPALSFESGDDFMLPVGTYPNMNRIRVWCAFVSHWFFSHRTALHLKSVSADGTPLGGPPSHFACENTYQNACRCF